MNKVLCKLFSYYLVSRKGPVSGYSYEILWASPVAQW